METHKECGLEKLRGSNHHNWVDDREKLKLDRTFRKRCYKALQSSLKATDKEKVGRTSDMLGYGPKELQEHITNHPNWDNVKDKRWHLDHIFPIEAFIQHKIYDLKLINCLENLRPITQRENNQKKDKYGNGDYEFKVYNLRYGIESLYLTPTGAIFHRGLQNKDVTDATTFGSTAFSGGVDDYLRLLGIVTRPKV